MLGLSSHAVYAATPRLAAGASHTVALKSSGTVLAWGNNDEGQIGDGTNSAKSSPVQVSGLVGVIAIAAGSKHSLAVRQDGSVWGWGDNSSGQLGDGTTQNRNAAVQVQGLSGVIAIGAGAYHSIALRSDGTVWAWGNNGYGQLGDSSGIDRTLPVQVSGVSGVTMIAAGGYHSLFLQGNGAVWACGANGVGQLGNGSTSQELAPVKLSGVGGISFISAGSLHSFAVGGGVVWAWGSNSHGQLGDGTTTSRSSPVQLQTISGVVAIGGGEKHSLAIRNDSSLWAWGGSGNGQLGDGATASRPTPFSVTTNVSGIACGGAHSVLFKADGVVWSWGSNGSGQLGDGSTSFKPVFVQVQGVTGLAAASGGRNHTIALKNGAVWSWGSNGSGQLGDGTSTSRCTPSAIAGLTGVVAVAAGANHTLALLGDGTVWAWGSNALGQLGDGTATSRSAPVQVTGLTGISRIAAGDMFSLARKSDGTVWAWGANFAGQLGDGTNINRTAPVQITSLSSVSAIAAGYMHGMALKSDGTVWAWGYNSSGQLGNGTNVFTFTPLQTNITGVFAIAAGASFSTALKWDGTVWAWGSNAYGQLGDGTFTNVFSPTQTLGLYGVTAIATGAGHAVAIRGDGTVSAWGANYFGQLGDGSTINRNFPVQLQSLAGVGFLVAGDNHTIAVKGDGTGWAAGNNNSGELGDGTPFFPLQVPGINLFFDVTPPATTAYPPGGSYYNQVSVTLSINEPGETHYTIDGSTPTVGSPLYSGPISVNSSSMLKFFSIDAAGNSEAVKTLSYVVTPAYPLTIIQSGGGSGSVTLSTGGTCSGSCSESFPVGTEVTLTSAPSAGCAFVGWSGCDTIAGATCGINMTAAKTVTAIFSRKYPLNLAMTGIGTGAVTFSNGESCSGNCTKTFDSTLSVTLTPAPGPYSAFAGWTGCDAVVNTVCTVSMATARNVTATFSAAYPLDLSMAGGGVGSVAYSTGQSCTGNCSHTFAGGTSVVLTATAGVNSVFGGWLGCDATSGTSCTVNVSASRSVTATFLPAFILNLSFTGGGAGTVDYSNGDGCSSNCAKLFAASSTISLTPSPAAGSFFSQWVGCDSVSGTTCTVTMSSAKNVSVIFEPVYPLNYTKIGAGNGTVSFSTGGSCAGSCTRDVNSGTTVTLTATAGSSAIFSNWTGCDSVNGNICTVTLSSAKNVSAVFNVAYQLNLAFAGYAPGTVNFSDGRSCAGNCTQTMAGDTDFQLTPVPGPSATFEGWTGCDSVSGTTCVFRMTANRNISAIFKTSYQLNLEIDGSGTVNLSTGGSCTTNCSRNLTSGSSAVFTAVTGGASPFVGWNGCDLYNGASCTVTMVGARSVTAIFGHLAKTTFDLYTTLQSAYSNLFYAETLKIRGVVFNESLNLNRTMPLTIAGGYDASFETVTGMSTMVGTLTVSSGMVFISNLTIQ